MKRYTNADILLGDIKTTVIHLKLPVRIVNYAKQLAKKEDYEFRKSLQGSEYAQGKYAGCDYKQFLQEYLLNGFAMEQARIKRAKTMKAKANAKAANAGKRTLRKTCRRVTL